jgi:hypothetical protein
MRSRVFEPQRHEPDQESQNKQNDHQDRVNAPEMQWIIRSRLGLTTRVIHKVVAHVWLDTIPQTKAQFGD